VDYEHLKEVLKDPFYQYYISVMLTMAPAVRIFSRTGMKAWPALFLLVPYVGYLFCAACLAFLKWPRLPAKAGKA
jgi:hypothetical protein